MDSYNKLIQYNDLVSHTFPGFILVVEFFIILDYLSPFQITKYVTTHLKDVSNLLAIALIVFVISTIAGLILDSIQHTIFGFTKKFLGKSETIEQYSEVHPRITTLEQLTIYQSFDDDYWYYYESYINLAIALLPSLIVVPLVCVRLNISTHWIYIFDLFVAIIIVILVVQSVITYNIADKLEDDFGKSQGIIKK